MPFQSVSDAYEPARQAAAKVDHAVVELTEPSSCKRLFKLRLVACDVFIFVAEIGQAGHLEMLQQPVQRHAISSFSAGRR